MNYKSLIKRLACFLLAALMLFSVIGCKDTTKKKKKKIIKKKVVIVQNDDTVIPPTTDTAPGDTDIVVRIERELPSVAEDEGLNILDDPIVDEFDHTYETFNLNNDYVIIYGLTEWDKRYEGYSNYGTASQAPRQVEYTAENRLAAQDIATWAKDNYNYELNVYQDTVYADLVSRNVLTGDENKILVGKSLYNPNTTLKDNEFEVRVEGDNLVFDGGHFAMVESAVDWFRSVEIKEDKMACLKSKNLDFKSQVVIDGVTYDYIWGDEFAGYEFNDDEKWAQSTFGLERQDDMANIFDDPKFQYVENGKVRLTGDRYYDEGNAAVGYATSGQIDTDNAALFRNGYFEFYARLPYRRGGFPAIWTMTADANCSKVPNYTTDDGYGVYSKRVWDIEFDLFESFADSTHMTTTIHKWYVNGYESGKNIVSYGQTPIDLTEEEIAMVEKDIANTKASGSERYNWVYDTPLTKTDDSGNQVVDENGDPIYVRYPITINFGLNDKVDLFKYRLSPFTNMTKSNSTYAYQFSYLGNVNERGSYRRKDDDGLYGDWRWYFNENTINNEYHLNAIKYTSDHCTVYMDGVKFLDFDWDPAYDYKDFDGDGKVEDISRDNNGVGFDLWHYFLVDMMIYTPGNFKIDYARKIQAGDCPFNLYIDYVRFYQDLDDTSQAVHFNNGTGDV